MSITKWNPMIVVHGCHVINTASICKGLLIAKQIHASPRYSAAHLYRGLVEVSHVRCCLPWLLSEHHQLWVDQSECVDDNLANIDGKFFEARLSRLV